MYPVAEARLSMHVSAGVDGKEGIEKKANSSWPYEHAPNFVFCLYAILHAKTEPLRALPVVRVHLQEWLVGLSRISSFS